MDEEMIHSLSRFGRGKNEELVLLLFVVATVGRERRTKEMLMKEWDEMVNEMDRLKPNEIEMKLK